MTTIVKVGGGRAINLDGIAGDLAAMRSPCVVVHGANAARDDLAEALGVPRRVLTSVSGHQSVHSDDRMIDVMLMAYAGLRNKRLVEMLQRRGVDAVGLTGLDGRLIRGRRNRGIRVRDGDTVRLVHDHSGKPEGVNLRLLGLLLEEGYLPVITVPLADETGAAINADNDDVVAVLQTSLRAARVIHLIEAPGILRDPSDPASAIARLEPADLAALEQRATGRMKRKLRSIRRMFEGGSPTVVVADGRGECPLAAALEGRGTTIACGAAAAALTG
ncbi:MAG: [LysW]-aminoadipate kinase [Candidatus Polarisedimenticolia bacterium]